jgi:NAD(P)-dependent dehydrogenase (short-subunit alcohol dehydrogenase family)
LVTGVSRGIGHAAAEELLREGMPVLGSSRSAPPSRNGLEHVVIDMQQADAGRRPVTACPERFGGLDVLVNNIRSGRIGTGFSSESDET